MEPDEAALLAAIRATPHDDTARLAYADWLEERGDGRGEYVRLQQQLAQILGRLQHLRAGLDPNWVEAVEISRDVVLHGFDPEHRRVVLKLVRLHTSLGPEDARDLLAHLPATVRRDLPLERAEWLRQEFAAVAGVTIEPSAPCDAGASPVKTPDAPPAPSTQN